MRPVIEERVAFFSCCRFRKVHPSEPWGREGRLQPAFAAEDHQHPPAGCRIVSEMRRGKNPEDSPEAGGARGGILSHEKLFSPWQPFWLILYDPFSPVLLDQTDDPVTANY